MDSQEDNVVIIFMNPFNVVHAFTELLKWRDFINNADLLHYIVVKCHLWATVWTTVIICLN